MFSHIVGDAGAVFAFEPTAYFRNVLTENVKENNVHNVKIPSYGLSDTDGEYPCYRYEASASIHTNIEERVNCVNIENILCRKMDNVFDEFGVKRLDFIKMDVDGHEPAILKGARNILNKFSPIVLLEISHLHYRIQGTLAWDFYAYLKKEGYNIYDEDNIVPLQNETDFLTKCGNFAYGRNIVISKNPL
jgi:FkbM family methyltransferase